MKIRLWIASVCIVLCSACFAQHQALTNDSIVKMVKAGLGESTIVSVIQSQPGSYTLTPDAVKALRQAGVTNKELAAMAVKGTTVAASENSQSSIYNNLEIGVYYRSNGKWVMLPSETVSWKTGGILKMIASDGFVQNDVNGRLQGKTSSLKLTAPLRLLIETPDGAEGTDFHLVYLHVKKHAREFRTVTGGFLHRSGNLSKDEVSFKQRQLARYTYAVDLPANFIHGEYAFLVPGFGSAGTAGKAYTFDFVK